MQKIIYYENAVYKTPGLNKTCTLFVRMTRNINEGNNANMVHRQCEGRGINQTKNAIFSPNPKQTQQEQ